MDVPPLIRGEKKKRVCVGIFFCVFLGQLSLVGITQCSDVCPNLQRGCSTRSEVKSASSSVVGC